MSARQIAGPELAGGHWVWRGGRGEVEVRFTGRGPAGERGDVLGRIEENGPPPPPVAWVKQVHSARALPARPGGCGEGDALYAAEAGLALSVVTADCVPVLLAGPGPVPELVAVHAGWRGIAGGVVAAALAAAGAAERGRGWTAWIGPAIGPCCYEVGEEVAQQVAAAAPGAGVVLAGRAGRPHLNLGAAVRHQLAAAGVVEIHQAAACTRCDGERLYSYRREGRGAGRNMAFIWRRCAP